MIKKYLWMGLGFLSLGMAYIGVVVPGIPFSIFLVCAAYCFAKSSPRMHAWLYNHKHFGPFLTNWTQKSVFPTKGKYAMVLVMQIFEICVRLRIAAQCGCADASGCVWRARLRENNSTGTLRGGCSWVCTP